MSSKPKRLGPLWTRTSLGGMSVYYVCLMKHCRVAWRIKLRYNLRADIDPVTVTRRAWPVQPSSVQKSLRRGTGPVVRCPHRRPSPSRSGLLGPISCARCDIKNRCCGHGGLAVVLAKYEHSGWPARLFDCKLPCRHHRAGFGVTSRQVVG